MSVRLEQERNNLCPSKSPNMCMVAFSVHTLPCTPSESSCNSKSESLCAAAWRQGLPATQFPRLNWCEQRVTPPASSSLGADAHVNQSPGANSTVAGSESSAGDRRPAV